MDALEAIGQPSGDDWRMDPSGHADELEARASDLAAVLRDKRIGVSAQGFAALDQSAIQAQKKYKFWMNVSIVAGVVTSEIAAFAVIIGLFSASNGEPLKNGLRILVMLQFLTLFAGAGLVSYSRRKQWFQTWREKRACAEGARALYFADVLQASEGGSGSSGELGARAFAYVRRFFWYAQLQYFETQGGKHFRRNKARRNRHRMLTLCIILTGLITAVLGTYALLQVILPGKVQLSALDDLEESLFVAFGILASSLLAANLSAEALHEDGQNAARYRFTADKLKTLGGETWEDPNDRYKVAEADAMRGDFELAHIWLRDLVTKFEQEHAQWLSAEESRAIDDQLTKALAG